MNEEIISALGGFCTELLNSEDFDALCKYFAQQSAVDILNTDPKNSREREAIYASYQGFESFLALTKKFSDAYNHKQPKQNVEETTQDFDDPSVHDIYRNTN